MSDSLRQDTRRTCYRLSFAVASTATGEAGGVAARLRISRKRGSTGVAHLNVAPAMRRTALATEAMSLMMQLAFRRHEWKCNALNQASRRAGQSPGSSFEGVFRQPGVVKGRNRDTA
ncbi:MAG TPA: GNAT family protein [Accumulibacter sp.]|uniref:GNAT family N-acetyltransferase n=1 Tax=Accumulibacter sp. TaxID=2053492 RepID=UPI002BB17CFC|nr:GNAT family protein [Accumulibacter sp.]HRF72368.1 GNAT family protein [Accumulibacter sp.]